MERGGALALDMPTNHRTPLVAVEQKIGAVDLADALVPLLRTGDWTIPEFADRLPGGRLSITEADLDQIEANWKSNARRGNIPVRGAAGKTVRLPLNEANTEHIDTKLPFGAKVGKLVDVFRPEPDRLVGRVSLTKIGEGLIRADAFEYSSAELLPHYTDTETGVEHGLTLTGVALSNVPRIKELGSDQLLGESRASLVACSETAVPDAFAWAQNRRVALADFDTDGDDDGPVPLCIYQPPVGCCPGFTAWPGDTDGDGTCLLATRGCNGYRAVPDDDAAPPAMQALAYSEVPSMAGEPNKEGTIALAEHQSVVERLNLAEGRVTTLQVQLTLSETALTTERDARQAAEGKVAAIERTQRIGAMKAELSELSRQGKVTPFEVEKYEASEDALMRLSEDDFLLDLYRNRPAVVQFAEIGADKKGGDGRGAETPRNPGEERLEAIDKVRKEKGLSFAEARNLVATGGAA